jgi:hypothetical protein
MLGIYLCSCCWVSLTYEGSLFMHWWLVVNECIGAYDYMWRGGAPTSRPRFKLIFTCLHAKSVSATKWHWTVYTFRCRLHRPSPCSKVHILRKFRFVILLCCGMKQVGFWCKICYLVIGYTLIESDVSDRKYVVSKEISTPGRKVLVRKLMVRTANPEIPRSLEHCSPDFLWSRSPISVKYISRTPATYLFIN